MGRRVTLQDEFTTMIWISQINYVDCLQEIGKPMAFEKSLKGQIPKLEIQLCMYRNNVSVTWGMYIVMLCHVHQVCT